MCERLSNPCIAALTERTTKGIVDIMVLGVAAAHKTRRWS
jgi:hypothetical protein